MKIPTNVERGAAMLDERLPGWRDHVDPDTLELEGECDCVLGQLFGGYTEGEELLGLSTTESRRLGFLVYGRQTWDALNSGWLRVLGGERR